MAKTHCRCSLCLWLSVLCRVLGVVWFAVQSGQIIRKFCLCRHGFLGGLRLFVVFACRHCKDLYSNLALVLKTYSQRFSLLRALLNLSSSLHLNRCSATTCPWSRHSSVASHLPCACSSCQLWLTKGSPCFQSKSFEAIDSNCHCCSLALLSTEVSRHTETMLLKQQYYPQLDYDRRIHLFVQCKSLLDHCKGTYLLKVIRINLVVDLVTLPQWTFSSIAGC